jgi:hypothetical protein
MTGGRWCRNYHSVPAHAGRWQHEDRRCRGRQNGRLRRQAGQGCQRRGIRRENRVGRDAGIRLDDDAGVRIQLLLDYRRRPVWVLTHGCLPDHRASLRVEQVTDLSRMLGEGFVPENMYERNRNKLSYRGISTR